MAVTVIQTPQTTFDMAYGANPITLAGITPSEDKYALKVFIVGQADPIADIRQTPNRQGRAIFDIQNILQAYVGPQVNTVDSQNHLAITSGTALSLAGPTLIEYQFAYALETGGIVGAFTTEPTVFTVIAGSKQYFEVPFDTNPYQVKASTGSYLNCTAIDRTAGPLSDNEFTIADDIPGTIYSSPGGIDVHNVWSDDQCTKTFYSPVQRDTVSPPSTALQGLEGFYILQYSAANNLIATNTLPNIQGNGGGPNVSLGQGTLVSGAFQTVTIATGPANLAVPLNAATAYYYIIPAIYGCSDDPQSQIDLMTQAAWRAQKYIINPEPCNDYPHVQFAWQNSYGYRDQFTFTKKSEHKTNTKNNNYLRGAADYNSTSYDVDLQDRGSTTYSQKIENLFSVQSGYMQDKEAELLKHLYQSGEVKVRFSEGAYANQWVPVILTNTRYTEKTFRKDRLFQYDVSFKLASNVKSMRG
tara:strand:+ start:4277 stop:5689 length:1413 start_codon:yes stop_codon:yes gene_type:complete